MSFNQSTRQRGVSLIELVLFIVIIGIAVGGILGVLNLTTKRSANPLRHKQALMIAEALLEEVELAKFTYCDPNSADAEPATSVGTCATPEAFGPEPGQGDRPYDNVNDYVALPNVPTAAFNVGGKLADANNNQMNVSGYSANLTIVPESLGGIDGRTAADPNVLRITVEVSYDQGHSVVLDGYRTRYAPIVE